MNEPFGGRSKRDRMLGIVGLLLIGVIGMLADRSFTWTRHNDVTRPRSA